MSYTPRELELLTITRTCLQLGVVHADLHFPYRFRGQRCVLTMRNFAMQPNLLGWQEDLDEMDSWNLSTEVQREVLVLLEKLFTEDPYVGWTYRRGRWRRAKAPATPP